MDTTALTISIVVIAEIIIIIIITMMVRGDASIPR